MGLFACKWLRAPATTETALCTQLFAKQPQATLRGTAPGIGSPLCFSFRPAVERPKGIDETQGP
jgi:hypothetical protein